MKDAPEPTAPTWELPANRAARFVGTTAGVATLFLLLRLFAVSDWNWRTAASISSTLNFGDAIPIILGTLLREPTLTGAVLAVFTSIVVFAFVWPPTTPRVWSMSGLLLPLAASVASVSWFVTFREWWFLALVAASTAVIVIGRTVWREGVAREAITRLHRRMEILPVLALLFLAVAVQTPWMPHERITTTGDTVQGYVLGDQPGFLRVLTDDRDVVILTISDVKSREIVD